MKTTFQKQVRKAYLSTAVGKMERLMATEQRWRKRETFARNRRLMAAKAINDYAVELAKESLERTGVAL